MENEVTPLAVEATQAIVGEVVVRLDEKGGLHVSAPANHIVAIAILEAGKSFINMQMHDAVRRMQTLKSPTIVRGDEGMVKQAAKVFGGNPS